jgi:hypothetical protein
MCGARPKPPQRPIERAGDVAIHKIPSHGQGISPVVAASGKNRHARVRKIREKAEQGIYGPAGGILHEDNPRDAELRNRPPIQLSHQFRSSHFHNDSF